MSIVAEAPCYIQAFSDGSVKQFEPEVATASIEPINGYVSKDVVIDPLKPIFGRMYLPVVPESETDQQLPILVYCHGGGFCIGSTTWLGYHIFLGDLSVKSKSIILSVDYSLAPENRLPTAYEDCYSALEWLIKNLEYKPWLKRADLSPVFLSGDSAGGNIVHQVAIRAIGSDDFRGRLKGLLPIHPYFGTEKRTELEMADGSAGDVEMNGMFWRLGLPKDQTVIVFIAGLYFLKERGVLYADFLKKKGVKRVELVEAEAQVYVYHVFYADFLKKKGVKRVELVEAGAQVYVYHVFYPQSEATRVLQKQMIDFMHSF